MKVLFGMALRQTTGFVESLLRLIGRNWMVPNVSTLSRRQKTLKVNIPYRGSQGPLHLLIDSTGIKVEARARPRVSYINSGNIIVVAGQGCTRFSDGAMTPPILAHKAADDLCRLGSSGISFPAIPLTRLRIHPSREIPSAVSPRHSGKGLPSV